MQKGQVNKDSKDEQEVQDALSGRSYFRDIKDKVAGRSRVLDCT
jgi:hypothetical protein|tara:strand:+ start:1275 stop:1406 length:132 start_codon:yes stop_codon:yes gene_type:complete